MSKRYADKQLESCSECTCFNIRKASRSITKHFDMALQPSGLRATQFSILVVLSSAGSITVTRLSRYLVMDRTTLTRNLKPLANRGFVQMKPGQDLRTRTVKLTTRGRTAVLNALPLWEDIQDKIISKLGEKRLNSFIRDLSEVSALFFDNRASV
jgi:DNA-binding MarR family transcriptional regulator